MKRILLLGLLGIIVTAVQAQKKLVPVTKSALTGIDLPNGSKQDSRILSVAAAATLLEMESNKTNSKVQNTEVLVLPPASINKFNKDSLVKRLVVRNWKIIPTESANYLWVQKDKRVVIAYFAMNAKQTDLYLAEAISSSVVTTQANNTTSNQSSTQTIVQPATQPVNQATAQNVNQPSQNKTEVTTQEVKKDPIPQNAQATSGKFTFSTTNFDDGWVSTVQEDWVQVTKGNVKVLIHYPNKSADAYNSVLMDGLKNAWNILVAPKYSAASNFEFKPITSWQSIEFAEADAVEKTTGKSVHVVFFKINYSNGSGKYLEFITPDKKTYEQEFGPYHDTSYGWEKVENMAMYNKFAVSAADLNGTWTTNFTGMTQYVNAYTGADAGASTHASSQTFVFSGDTYHWEISVASGMVGNIKFQNAKSDGKFSMVSNWQVKFSDMEGKPKTYDAYFSCIKGARMLWLSDTSYPGYTGFGKKE